MNARFLSEHTAPEQADIDMVEEAITRFEVTTDTREREAIFEGELTDLARALALRFAQHGDPLWGQLFGRIITATSIMAAEDISSLVEDFGAATPGYDFLKGALETNDLHSRMLSTTLAVSANIADCKVIYRITTERPGPRFPIFEGTLEVPQEGGQVDSFQATTGGNARLYSQRNGPTPPGRYRVSNYRPNRNISGMTLDGVSYSFDVEEVNQTEVYGRSALRIHPDGPPPGTRGCIGVLGPAFEQRRATLALNSALQTAVDAGLILRLAVVYP